MTTSATLAAVGTDDELVELRAVAATLKTTCDKLRRLSLRGEFPPLLRVTRKHLLVRRAEFEAWQAGRWTTAEATRTAIVVAAARGEVKNRRRKVRPGASGA
ncbi:MAG: hypothetical protein JNK15_03210 [Planctomycetes bacterium]|nr:hypothetical protein [Planctomycetota bacterium]